MKEAPALFTLRDVAARLHKSPRWVQDYVRDKPLGRLAGRTRVSSPKATSPRSSRPAMPLKVVRRHGSPFYYLRGSVRGKLVDESTKVGDRAQAEAIRAKREWEIINRDLGGRRAAQTFLEAAVAYMEAGGEARFIKPLLDHFRTKPLSEIGQDEVERAALKLYSGLKPASVNRMVFTPVSAIIAFAAKRGRAERPSFARPKQPRGRVRWATHEEAETLIAASAPHLAPLVAFLFYTGARVGEALALDWRDVDLKRAHCAFLDTKNDERRGIYLHPKALAALANLKHRDGRVFRRPDGRLYEPKDHSGGQIKTAFRSACRRAGLKDFHPHDCRHTYATWHYMANRDLRALQELGGWKSLAMVQRYAHVSAEHLAASVLRIGGNYGDADPKPDNSSIKTNY
jgi:integrase